MRVLTLENHNAFISGAHLCNHTHVQTANTSAGIPAQMQLGLLSPLYLRRLFERMGATYIKLGQVRASSNFVL